MYILNTRIDNLNEEEIIEKVREFLDSNNFHQIATVNPEFILTAQKDQEFKNILNNCDLNAADGFGIKLAFWRKGERLKTRIAGADLMQEILKIASEKNLGVFLVASDRGLSNWEETRNAILKKYLNLKISGINYNCHSESFEESTKNGLDPSTIAQDDKYNISQAYIVFANLGAPFQEKFLHSLKNQENAKIRLAMGVGGSFDYLTGKVRRAPVLMRKLGLEWLWRLIQQPQRLKRIWNAVIIFPIKVTFNKMSS